MLEQKIGNTYIREWIQPDPKANLVLIHGVAEHSGRYGHVAEYFFQRGINVYTGDLIGHGLSDGERVFVNTAQDYLDNVQFFLERIENDKPIFILGHSMGGFVVLYFALKQANPKIKGIIASSPYIQEYMPLPPWKLFIGRCITRLNPKLKIASNINSAIICSDPEIRKKHAGDKLICDGVTTGWYVALEKARKHLIKHAAHIKYPCLMLQAGADIIVNKEAVKEFYEKLTVEDKTFECYKGLYHELLNEPEKEVIMERIYNWITERIES